MKAERDNLHQFTALCITACHYCFSCSFVFLNVFQTRKTKWKCKYLTTQEKKKVNKQN